jgi:hypothetical protein
MSFWLGIEHVLVFVPKLRCNKDRDGIHAKMSVVDLAGAERTQRTGNSGKRTGSKTPRSDFCFFRFVFVEMPRDVVVAVVVVVVIPK